MDESAPLLLYPAGVPVSGAQETEKTYGAFAAFSFTVNFIMGVGILSLPYAFYHAGVILSPIFMVIVSLLSFTTVMYIFESAARAEAYVSGGADYEIQHQLGPKTPRFEITRRRFDMRTMAKLWLGRWGWHFDIALMLFTYGGQWSFAATFGAALTANVPLPFLFTYNESQPCNVYHAGFRSNTACLHTYYVWVGVFALVVIPLSCIELTDQAWLQMSLTVFRFVAVSLIVGTVAVGLATAEFDGKIPEHGPPYSQPVNLLNWNGFGNLFTAALFAQMMHNAAPNIAQPLRDKSKLPFVFLGAFAVTFGIYVLVGIICAVYFGEHVLETVTLMWANFNGWKPAGSPIPWWAEAIHWILSLFPPIDVISAYPLGSIALATNLFSILPKEVQQHPRWKLWKFFTNLVAAIPPLIGALFVWNLATIINVSGLFAFFIVFITPALLYLFSRRKCAEVFGQWKTPYSLGPFSSPVFAVVILVVGTASLGLSIALLIDGNLFGSA